MNLKSNDSFDEKQEEMSEDEEMLMEENEDYEP